MIITKKTIETKIIAVIFFTIIFNTTMYSQNIDSVAVKKAAIIMVYADFIPIAAATDCNTLDCIVNEYNLTVVYLPPIVDFLFFKITKKDNCCSQCSYYLAYDCMMRNFYRLGGFKNNDFRFFYNELVDNNHWSKKQLKAILASRKIGDNTIQAMYDMYYKNTNKGYIDPSACTQKQTFYKIK